MSELRRPGYERRQFSRGTDTATSPLVPEIGEFGPFDSPDTPLRLEQAALKIETALHEARGLTELFHSCIDSEKVETQVETAIQAIEDYRYIFHLLKVDNASSIALAEAVTGGINSIDLSAIDQDDAMQT